MRLVLAILMVLALTAQAAQYVITPDGVEYRVTVDGGLVYDLSEIVNVKAYGAVGDGVTDDTTAIQNAINAAKNGSVYIPEGIYKLTSTLTVGTMYSDTSWYCRVFGAGRGTILWASEPTMRYGIWFKKTATTVGAGKRPGYNNKLEHLTMVGPDAVSGGAYVGFSTAPTDTVTLLKTGFHVIDGDSTSLDCDFAMNDVNLWCANIGWEMYYTHYGNSYNIGFENNNKSIVANGSHATRISNVNSRVIWDTGIDIKACDGFYLGSPVMQVQHGLEAIKVYGAARGVVIESPYFEQCDSLLVNVVGTGANTGPSVSIIGGISVSSTNPVEIWNQGADLRIDGLRDPYSVSPSTGGVSVVSTTYLSRRSRTEIGPTSMVTLEADSLQYYTKGNFAAPPVESDRVTVDGNRFSGAIGTTTKIPTSRRGGGVFTVTRRTSSSAAAIKSMGVFVSETGAIDTVGIGGALDDLTFTDDGGYLKVTCAAGGASYVVNWSYFDSLTE